MREFVIYIVSTLLFSCGAKNVTGQTEHLIQIDSIVMNKVHYNVHRIDTLVIIDRKMTPYKGDIRYKAGWRDSNGENVMIISGTYDYKEGMGRAEIFAYQYQRKVDETWERVWSINDFVDGFGCDLAINLPNKYIQIIDLNDDGILESSFLYTLDNRCDAVMVETKMMIHIQNEKYAIRGFSDTYLMPKEDLYNTYRDEEGLPPVKYKNVDAELNRYPKMKNYYSRMWDDFLEKR